MSDISELFSRDPLSLTKADIGKIIDQMRSSRHAFNAGNIKAGNTKPPTEKQKVLNDLASKLKISL